MNSLEAARDDILPKCLSKSPSNVDLASFLGSVFLVGDVIGQGVSGEVLRATRTVNGNAVEVALKVFRRDTSEKDVRAEYAVLQRLHKLWVISNYFHFEIFSEGSLVYREHSIFWFSPTVRSALPRSSFLTRHLRLGNYSFSDFELTEIFSGFCINKHSWRYSMLHEIASVNLGGYSSVCLHDSRFCACLLTVLILELAWSTVMWSPKIFCFHARLYFPSLSKIKFIKCTFSGKKRLADRFWNGHAFSSVTWPTRHKRLSCPRSVAWKQSSDNRW